jgi:DNA-binding Lrp family transcriptional regulator
MTLVPRSTFRDPSGYVEFTPEEVLRRVHAKEAEGVLRGRDALYDGLTAERMQAAFASHFSVASRCDLANGRTLSLMEKR